MLPAMHLRLPNKTLNVTKDSMGSANFDCVTVEEFHGYPGRREGVLRTLQATSFATNASTDSG